MSFRKRVILVIVASQVVIAAVLNGSIYFHRATDRRQFEESAVLIAARCATHGCAAAMGMASEQALQRFVVSAMNEHGSECRYVVVENDTGQVIATTDLAVTRGRPKKGISTVSSDANPLAAAGPAMIQRFSSDQRVGAFADIDIEVAVPVNVDGARAGLLRMGFSMQRLRAWQSQVALTGILLTIAALAVGLALAFFVDRRLMGSLKSLIDATEHMEAGDLDRRVSITTGDELQTLGDRFNQMASRLAATISHLHEHEEVLESRVRERTRELEQERQMLSGIVTSVGAGLLVIDRDMRVIWTNQVLDDWCGPDLARPHHPCREVLGSAGLCSPECPGASVFSNGGVHRSEIETSIDGVPRHFLVTATPIRDEAGKVVRALELVQDVTREKEMESGLIQASKLAAIGELAAGVAHQMSNPLAVISAHAERLSELVSTSGIEDPRVARHCEVVKKHVFRCRETIEKLLGFARRGQVRIKPVDVLPCVEEAIAVVQGIGHRHQTSIKSRLPGNLPRARANPEGLMQVMVNVLVNAVDSAGETGKVMVDAQVEGERLSLTITDDGPGVPEGLRSKIFEPFFTTKAPGKGTGLGLAMCRRIMEGMQGEIGLDRANSQGASFKISLPLATKESRIV